MIVVQDLQYTNYYFMCIKRAGVINSEKRFKTKKRDALSSVSLIVPLTLPTSNSFYENVDELYALKETLLQQGILSNEGNGLALARD